MNKLPSLTVGIPAYNEADNILRLLIDLSSQKQDSFRMNRIIVNSDGSSDDMVSLLSHFRIPKLEIWDKKDRRGPAYRQNQIMESVNADILVLLNADIKLKDEHFLNKIADEIINKRVDLVSTRLECVTPRTFIGRTLVQSVNERTRVYEKYRKGHNLYTCHGAARGMSRSFYHSLNFPGNIAEDAYSYLFCLKNNFRYSYLKDVSVFIRWPESVRDHLRQSSRFFHSTTSLITEFDQFFLNQEYKLPNGLIVSSLFRFMGNYPLYFISYALLFGLSFVFAMFTKPKEIWSTVTSSKKLI